MTLKTSLKATVLFALTGCMVNCTQANKDSRKNCVDVAVFAINDFHAGLESIPSNGIPGAASLIQTLDSLKAVYPYHVTLAAGDNFGGSYFYKLTYENSPLPQLFKDLGIRVSTLGNHEFDDGQDKLEEKWKHTNRYPEGWEIEYVCANVKDSLGNIPSYIRPWTVIPVALPGGKEVKVSVVGLLTANTPNQAKASNLVGLTFDGRYKEILDSLAQTPDYAPAKASQIHVLLTHIGTYQKEGVPCWDDPEIENLKSIHTPEIDGIITGHSHELVYGRINEAQYPVVQARSHGAAISFLKFTVDTTAMKLVATEPMVVPVSAKKQLNEKAQGFQNQLDELMATTYHSSGAPIGMKLTVAKNNIPHNRRNKHRQTAIGGWACASFAEAYRKAAGLGDETPVVGISHFGNIRTGIAQGPVKVLNVGEILPFGNAIRVFKMSGEHLMKIMNVGFHNQKYGQIQIANLEVALDGEKNPQSMIYVSPKGVKKTIGAKDFCYVCADEFMTTGGDGYPTELFPEKMEVKGIKNLPNTTNAFIEYLKTKPFIENPE